MTEWLKDVNVLAEKQEEIPFSNALIRDWMDDKVECLLKCRELYESSPERLDMGEFNPDEGEYTIRIECCSWNSNAKMEVHIYRGIDILAKAVNADVRVREYCDDSYCHYFSYKNVEFLNSAILIQRGNDMNKKERVCPICGRTYTDYPALSRRDNKTEICPECGIEEALNDYFHGHFKKGGDQSDGKRNG